MPQFQYTGRDRTGKKKTGAIIGISKREAVLKLREKGIAVMELQEAKQTLLNKEISIGPRVKSQQFVIFLRQFSTLLKAGVSVVDSTSILAGQTESKALKKVLIDVEEELRQGNPLSAAMGKHLAIFPSIVINMIAAGELGGSLEETLSRLADFFEKQHYTRQKIISAMTYPAIVGVVAVGVVIFLLAKVVPTFASMLEEAGGELPGITKFVLSASHIVQGYWWIILVLVFLFSLSIYLIRKKPSSKYYLDYAMLKLPLFGKMLQKSSLARMARTLSSLFSSSVPVLQALSIVEKVVENEVVARVLRQSRGALERGQRLAEPMKEHWIFPPLVTQMIAIGEETGSLDAMLGKVADFYEKEVETATDRLKSLIEPLMIVFLASVVGTIVISIIVPMFKIYDSVGK
ncbi:type II secretion system F family protein [Fictibacillus sp. KIGAM418]|uniref:Type II secretion system F family protein n=1 Tax=Fictibacillus marinisediminis TaxID=2878389 RepID=A0A9X2BHV7_9BACL|nr:type II secretion system F family protein [Fictibacillus marinisediminis]MCK6257923.1 type II secretion system F family protein [Fictibacillus marinisediminis]